MATLERYAEVIDALVPGKAYSYAELCNAASIGPASYVVQDLIAIGRIERVSHPILHGTFYRLKQ